jgi:hypothetical protein
MKILSSIVRRVIDQGGRRPDLLTRGLYGPNGEQFQSAGQPKRNLAPLEENIHAPVFSEFPVLDIRTQAKGPGSGKSPPHSSRDKN